MSPIAKLLLTFCDNDFRIDLKGEVKKHLDKAGFHYSQARLVALYMGMSIVGGS